MKLTFPQPPFQHAHALLMRGLSLLRPVGLGDEQERTIYRQMITRLQRDTLVLLMLVGLPLSLVFAVQLFFGMWADRAVPAWMFTTHVGRVIALAGWTVVFLWRKQVAVAWAGAIGVSLGTLLLQIGLLNEPGLLVFALFMLAGPLLVFSLRVTVPLLVALLLAFGLMMVFTPAAPTGWGAVGLFVATIAAGFGTLGIVIRRFVAQFAHVTAENQRAAVVRARAEQELRSLAEHVAVLSSLEHDLRQPLRAVQGYLALIGLDAGNAPVYTTPAQAAAERAERLINNVLDATRMQAHQYALLRQPTHTQAIFEGLQQAVPGLARYYTDPPVPVHFVLHDLPVLLLDTTQIERALLNVLDNALAHSPPDGVVTIRAWQHANTFIIKVCDQGSGIPADVVAHLLQGNAPKARGKRRVGLGLRQTVDAVHAHGGTIQFRTMPGTIVRIELPVEEAS